MLLRTLLAHYRRHPLQAVFLFTSIVLANVLLVGTLLINAQARASYAEGAQLLNSTPLGEIRAGDAGETIEERDYIVLRRQGFRSLAPLLERRIRVAGGEVLELLGIDPLALPRAGRGEGAVAESPGFPGFSLPPYELWVSPARLEQLGMREGERPETTDGRPLPPLRTIHGGGLGHRLLIDIAALQELTGSRGALTAILVATMSPGRLAALKAALPPHLVFVPADQAPDPAELTRSFHLNLAAMGLLAFVVGVFLTYNALSFSYTDRQDLLRKLRLSGVGRRDLRRALLLELALFLGLGGLLGMWLGAWLAGALLPGVGRTLAQLYGVYIRYPDALVPSGAWLPFGMTMVAGALCAAWPLRRSLQAPLLERWNTKWQDRDVVRRDRWFLLAGILLLAVSGVLALYASTTRVALAGMASLLLGASLCLPMVMRILLGLVRVLVPAGRPRLSWMLADGRWLLGPASLALMALTLALVANSGLNTMIHSFRFATDDWLQQRLAAQLYFRADVDRASLVRWLDDEAPGSALVERYRVDAEFPTPGGGAVRVEVVTLQNDVRFEETVGLMQSGTRARERFRSGVGLFISERSWRIEGWRVGDRLELCPGVEVPVLGVYRDYGNPLPQWMGSEALFRTCWPGQPPVSLAIIGPDALDWAGIRARLLDEYGLEQDEVISQAELKSVGMSVFDRTFRVTNALNSLTLLVAGIGIFCAVSAIHHHRVVQQALLAALGLSRRERGMMLLLQWGLLGLMCVVLVWPFGTLLAGYLATVVTPVAFGWSFALRPEWSHLLTLGLTAAACLVAAVALPSFRLLNTSPAVMLREESL